MRNTGSGFSGLISFMLTSLISLKSEGLSSLLQHRSSEASILRHFSPSSIYQIYYLPIEYLPIHLSCVNLFSLYYQSLISLSSFIYYLSTVYLLPTSPNLR